MRPLEPARWDDVVLAIMLLAIGLPRLFLAILYDRPFGVEPTLSLGCVLFALFIIAHRQRARRAP